MHRSASASTSANPCARHRTHPSTSATPSTLHYRYPLNWPRLMIPQLPHNVNTNSDFRYPQLPNFKPSNATHASGSGSAREALALPATHALKAAPLALRANGPPTLNLKSRAVRRKIEFSGDTWMWGSVALPTQPWHRSRTHVANLFARNRASAVLQKPALGSPVCPISLFTLPQQTLLDSNFPGNPLWIREFHPFKLRLCSSRTLRNPQC